MKNVIDQKPSDFSAGHHSRFLFVQPKHIKNKSILDIGCGYGWFELLAEEAGAKHVTGIEITKKDLKTAKKHVTSKKVTFKTGSAIDLPFADNSFDTIVSWEVLEHIPKNTEAQMFKEVARVLKPGGTFYFSTPHNNIIAKLTDPAWVLTGGEHRHYKRRQIDEYADGVGMHIDTYIVKGGLITIGSILNMYASKWILRREPLFNKRVEQWVEKDLASNKNKLSNMYVSLTNKTS